MKIVFAGPTLYGIEPDAFPSIAFRQPAARGDMVRAVRDGATMIGLIDGVFERMPSVWHKEILHALSGGVTVLGAASMGALRAAECHSFGMIGVGAVFEAYANGMTEDDEDVAQLHGPRELGYLPLSEPLVNVRATLAHLVGLGLLPDTEALALTQAAQSLFFKLRTYRRIVEIVDLPQARKPDLLSLLKTRAVNIKQRDARLLLDRMETGQTALDLDVHQFEWRLARTRSLRDLLQGDSRS